VTCDIADGGTQPLRSETWEYVPRDPCEGFTSRDDRALNVPKPPKYKHQPGFVAGTPELEHPLGTVADLTEEEAEAKCDASSSCGGFTFSGRRSPGARHVVHFKSSAKEVTAGRDWHSFKKIASAAKCAGALSPPPPQPLRFQVDVLRDSPPVFVVHDFATEEECDHMMNVTIPHMTPSVVGGGGTSPDRRSYSVNMFPDYDDEADVVTRVVRRKFSFARQVAEYAELVENEGQEPLNSVYYKDDGDQYRPHCDGECHGGPYRKGQRIATSLTYCAAAERGGYTMFTRSGLKVVPKTRQMLFFGYKHNGERPTMDDGLTEHTGCPLREGRKWIATMWYREGMTPEKNWEWHSGRRR